VGHGHYPSRMQNTRVRPVRCACSICRP